MSLITVRKKLPHALLLFALVMTVFAISGNAGRAAVVKPASNFLVLGMGYGDYIYNYDFTGQATNPNHVDWAASMLFWNDGFVNNVKDTFSSKYWCCTGFHPLPWSSPENDYLGNFYDGSGWVWDTDMGRKTGDPSENPCTLVDNHYRVYGPPSSDAMFTPRLGYFTIATTHIDKYEPCIFEYYTGSESTEKDLYNIAHSAGLDAHYDYAWWHNPEDWADSGGHYWHDDGYATYINIP